MRVVVVLLISAAAVLCGGSQPSYPATEQPKGPPPKVEPGVDEKKRVNLWQSYYKTWPRSWPNESHGFREYAVNRETEVMSLSDAGSQKRWEYWLDYMQIRIHPSFTSSGYAIRDVPAPLFRGLTGFFKEQWFGNKGVAESEVPYFITGDRTMLHLPGSLRTELRDSVRGIHEEWSGVPLEMTSLYGMRVYQNGSTLAMHVDRASTHVISAIIHVARDYGEEGGSWPIEVVDLDGVQREVELQPGQMLLYESSKCTHGRPKPFKGKYFASVFVHFKPTSEWPYENRQRIAAVPPHWNIQYSEWERTVLPQLKEWGAAGSAHGEL